MVQTKEERRLYKKEYREKNKEKIREQNREYCAKNKEKIREQNKEYRDTNKEEINEHMREYRAKNKEKIREYKKEYHKQYSQTPEGIKSITLYNWRSRGVIGDLSTIYDEIYLPSTECEVCNKAYSSTYDRCLDHCHETGEFRQILCRGCNTKDSWKKIIEIEI